jgi:hypothetical protein
MFVWLLLSGFGFLDDISVEVLVQDCFICSIHCHVPLRFSEYLIAGAVKRLSLWIIYEVLCCRDAVPNECNGSPRRMQRLSYLIRKMDLKQTSKHSEMLQK